MNLAGSERGSLELTGWTVIIPVEVFIRVEEIYKQCDEKEYKQECQI
ncbi:hypothetical protein KGY73_05080 [bacterium]|nr:hypothetical protein [bacterium]